VIFREHKKIYRRVQVQTIERDSDYIVPFGKGVIRREGKDLTFVTRGSIIYMALELARMFNAVSSVVFRILGWDARGQSDPPNGYWDIEFARGFSQLLILTTGCRLSGQPAKLDTWQIGLLWIVT
jgi:hypothetical protein